VTYRLIHTRFFSEAQPSHENSSASAPQPATTNDATTDEGEIPSESQEYGFARDETLYHQIRKRIAEVTEWDKRVYPLIPQKSHV